MRNSFLPSPLKLSSHLYIGPQLDEKQLEELASSGIKTVINLSKKGEFNQKLKPEEEASIVKELGLAYLHEPMAVGNMTSEKADELCVAVADAQKPVYLHCCFGQRSGTLGFIYHARRRKISFSATLAKAKKLGVDLSAPVFSGLIKKSLGAVPVS